MRRYVSALFVAALATASHAVLPPYVAAPAVPSVHKLHEVYFVQPHNTFDKPGTLTSYLDAGFRTVELDVIDREDWELDANGPYVSHDSASGNKNCSGNPDRLGHCLTDISNWLAAHPGQGPVLAFVDMKASWDPLNAWNNDEVYFLDKKVKDILGSRMYTADDLYLYATGTTYAPGQTPLRAAVASAGWPTLSALAGKVIVVFTGGKIGLTNQTQAAGIEYTMAQAGRKLPYGFFCPDVESDPNEIKPYNTTDGVSNATSQHMVCSNLKSQDHYQLTANESAKQKQLMHLWGDHVFGNGAYAYNYLAVAHGVSVIGRDSNESETWSGSLPLIGVRRALPGYFELRPLHAQSKCVDVSGSGTGNGTKIQLYDCNGSAAQQFVYSAEGQLRPKHYNPSCVDIKGGSAGNNKQVHLWDCDGGDSEKWVINANGQFQTKAGNYCLDVTGGGTANGTWMLTNTCNASSNSQKFRLEPVADWVQTAF